MGARRRASAGRLARVRHPVDSSDARAHARAGAYVEDQIRRGPLRERLYQLPNPRQRILAQPLDYVPVGRQQAQLAVALDRLQGPHPRIELLHREFALEHTQTAVP